MKNIHEIAERIRQQIAKEAPEVKDIGNWPISWPQQIDMVAKYMTMGANIAVKIMQEEIVADRLKRIH